MSRALPVLLVKTAHSEYRIDQNAGTFQRRPVHEDASDLARYGVGPDDVRDYESIVSGLEVGARMHIACADGLWVRSTPIVSVEELEASE